MCGVGRTYQAAVSVVARHDRHGTHLCAMQFFSKKVQYHNGSVAVVGFHLRGKGGADTERILKPKM